MTPARVALCMAAAALGVPALQAGTGSDSAIFLVAAAAVGTDLYVGGDVDVAKAGDVGGMWWCFGSFGLSILLMCRSVG